MGPLPNVPELRDFDILADRTTVLYESPEVSEPEDPTTPDVMIMLRLNQLPEGLKQVIPVSLDQIEAWHAVTPVRTPSTLLSTGPKLLPAR